MGMEQHSPFSDQAALEEARRILREEIEALRQLEQMVGEPLVRAAQMLARARQVITSGVGKSGIVAQKLAATLRSVGVAAHFLHPLEALHGDLGIVRSQDVALLISKSGTTAEILTLAQILRHRNIPVISLVHTADTPLKRLSTLTLECLVRREACPLQLAPTTSTTVATVVGDMLAGLIIRYNGVTVEDFAANHPAGQLGRNTLLKVADVMHTGAELPLLAPTASFRQVLVELSEKRLGCVCIVDDHQHLLGIITDGDVKRILQKVSSLEAVTAAEVMTTDPVTIHPDALLAEAVRIMEDRPYQINVLPVVDDHHRCIGVLRLHDVFRAELG